MSRYQTNLPRKTTYPFVAILLGLCAAGNIGAADAISSHPENPRYFLFRGKPLVCDSAVRS
jgi:hypothetical protein